MDDVFESHDQPHRLIDVRIVGSDGWALLFSANDSGDHHEFRLARGETAESELLACYAGAYDEDVVGVPSDDVLEMLAHVAWHVATRTPAATCDWGVA